MSSTLASINKGHRKATDSIASTAQGSHSQYHDAPQTTAGAASSIGHNQQQQAAAAVGSMSNGSPSNATKQLERLLIPANVPAANLSTASPVTAAESLDAAAPSIGDDWTATLTGASGRMSQESSEESALNSPIGQELTSATHFSEIGSATAAGFPHSPSSPEDEIEDERVQTKSTSARSARQQTSTTQSIPTNSVIIAAYGSTGSLAIADPANGDKRSSYASSHAGDNIGAALLGGAHGDDEEARAEQPPLPASASSNILAHKKAASSSASKTLAAPVSAARKRSLDRRGGSASNSSRHGVEATATTPDVDLGSFDSQAPEAKSSAIPAVYHVSAQQSMNNKRSSVGRNIGHATGTSTSISVAGQSAAQQQQGNGSSPAASIKMSPLTQSGAGAAGAEGASGSMDSFRYLHANGSSSPSSESHGDSRSSSNNNVRRYSGPNNATPVTLNEKFNPRAHTYSIVGFESAYPPPGASTTSHGSRKRLLSHEDNGSLPGAATPGGSTTVVIPPALGYSGESLGGGSTTLYNNYSADFANGKKKMNFRDIVNLTAINPFSWDTMDGKPEPDDDLHDPEKIDKETSSWTTKRAILNIGSVALLVAGLVMLFAGYPILRAVLGRHYSTQGGFGLGGTNATGQVSFVPGVRTTLIDPDTPDDAKTRVGSDGATYNLVFSDEFNTDGRSFYPGDDPFWTAVDLHYWATNNYEWYSPDAVTTINGALRITLSQYQTHNLNFRGGMLQSWNQFCFTGGIMVASVRLPGSASVPGLWPAVWTMGNLGRAGYGASLEGTWPYSYDDCDVGTLANQTDPATLQPNIDTLGDCVFNRKHFTKSLSFLPGQKLSKCTCPNDDHPGPKLADGTWKGRAAPEIDLFEAQVSTEKGMTVSQSAQLAPFNAYYKLQARPDLFSTDATVNTYTGEVTQQAASVVSVSDQQAVQYAADGTLGTFAEYGIQYEPGPTGYVEWINSGKRAWRLGPEPLAADPLSKISRRPVSEEPMYMIINLGISKNFGTVAWNQLQWPNQMDVDWVRVYQKGEPRIGCDPDDFPTKDYINRHIEAYTNANLTLWGNTRAEGGYEANWPRNRLYPGGCNAAPSKLPGGTPGVAKAPAFTNDEIAVDQTLCNPL